MQTTISTAKIVAASKLPLPPSGETFNHRSTKSIVGSSESTNIPATSITLNEE
jgi:hypothetical protein